MHLIRPAPLCAIPFLLSCLCGCTPHRATTTPDSPADAEQRRRCDTLRARGPTASMTILPVRLLGRPDANVADALGLVLEKAGMSNLEPAESAFVSSDEANWAEAPARLSEFVQAHPVRTAYVLYAEFLGDPASGPREVRFVLVDSSGNVVLSDRQTPADADFRRIALRDPDPMGCSLLVSERVFSRLGWKKQAAASEGRFARVWAEKSGLPSPAEFAAIRQRTEQFKAHRKAAVVEVQPTLAAGARDAESGQRLARLIDASLGTTGRPADAVRPLTVAPTTNELKRLWDLARALRESVRHSPPTADYTIVADILFDPATPGHGSVHVVVCDRAGEWVLVDLCNDQHADWQRSSPTSRQDVEKLAAARIAAQLK